MSDVEKPSIEKMILQMGEEVGRLANALREQIVAFDKLKAEVSELKAGTFTAFCTWENMKEHLQSFQQKQESTLRDFLIPLGVFEPTAKQKAAMRRLFRKRRGQ